MVSTILLTRIFLFITWYTPMMQPQIVDYWHHMYTGFILVCASLPFSSHHMRIVRAIGLGLFIDEWIHIFHIIFDVKHMDYWSWDFIAVALLGVLLLGKYYYKITLVGNHAVIIVFN